MRIDHTAATVQQCRSKGNSIILKVFIFLCLFIFVWMFAFGYHVETKQPVEFPAGAAIQRFACTLGFIFLWCRL